MLLYDLAKLNDQQLSKLQKWEQTSGKRALAFAGHAANLKPLNPGELADLQKLEKELGVTLIAVE